MGRPASFTRERLLQVARDTFALNGYGGTTLDDIARELGVTPSALLRHARSKEELFFEAMSGGYEKLTAALAAIDAIPATEDPRVVLRSFAERFIPFLERKLTENLVLVLHARSKALGNDPLAGFPAGEDSPPARVLSTLERYFKRLKRSGSLRLTDPRAAAILFLGSLHSYVFFHHLLKVSDPPFPLQRFIDQLFQLWDQGGLNVDTTRGGKRGR